MCGCEVIKNLSCGLSAPEIKAPLLFHKTCLTFTSCRGGRREITLRKDRRASRQYPEIRGQASVGTYRKQADRRSRDDANFLLHDLCNSGRCGDNTGILLRCRTFDFGSVPIRCGSFSFAVFLTAGDSVLNFVIIKTAPIFGVKGDEHHAEYSSVTPPNPPRVARITSRRDFVPPPNKTAHKRLCVKIRKGA